MKLDRQELVFFCRSCHQAARSRPLQGIDTGKGKQVQRDTKRAAVATTGGGALSLDRSIEPLDTLL